MKFINALIESVVGNEKVEKIYFSDLQARQVDEFEVAGKAAIVLNIQRVNDIANEAISFEAVVLELMQKNSLKICKAIPFSYPGYGDVQNVYLPVDKIGHISWQRLFSWVEEDQHFFESFLEFNIKVLSRLPWRYCERLLLIVEKSAVPIKRVDLDYNHEAHLDIESIVSLCGRIIEEKKSVRFELVMYYFFSEMKNVWQSFFERNLPVQVYDKFVDLYNKDLADKVALTLVKGWPMRDTQKDFLTYRGVDMPMAMEYELLEVTLDKYFFAFNRGV